MGFKSPATKIEFASDLSVRIIASNRKNGDALSNPCSVATPCKKKGSSC